MADQIAATNSEENQSSSTPQLRILLIGGRELNGISSGKSSAGNIILGQNVFDTSRRTAQSEAKQQDVFGRRVTVVDTPGWWWFYTRENTPKLDQMEIQNSVHLCPPGPHVFLLVIPVDSHLSQLVKPSLKEHLRLFNGDVFSHTIVLFTSVNSHGEKKLQSKIKTSPVLQWILQQCGNRKHFLNISNREDRDQVRLLIEKIEAIAKQNGGRHFSVDISHGNALSEDMKVLAERASKRLDEVQKQRRHLRALIEGGMDVPQHLKLIIVGAQYAAKSSTGNTILGKNAFEVNENGRRTTCCEINNGLFQGKQLTVVDSPGWFYNHTLRDTSKMDKHEIENSVHLCPPGPHAVLLVIVLATAINNMYKRAVKKHMGLFREEIWKHAIVVFTRGDWLGVKSVEERIESEEGLQWIVNKCGNRYHVLNNNDHSDKTQVKELLEKIEEMWAGNEDPYYEVDLDRAAQLETKRETEDKTVKRLKTINERKMRVLKEVYGGEKQQVSDIRIILVGQKCSGKSLAGNMILFNEKFHMAFDTTWLNKKDDGERNNTAIVKHEGNFNGVKVSVVETPGWFPGTTPPDWIKDEVLHSVSMFSPGPHVFLLLVPICRSFTEKDLKALEEILKPLTERVWRHCMVLFTWGDWLNDLPVENHIIREGKEIQELLEKCGNRYHVLNPNHFGDPVPIKELLQKIIDMAARNKECFTAQGKQKKFQLLSWQAKERTLTEEEWKKREYELIERVMKALAKEPEKATVPTVEIAESMDDKKFPYMSSEYGSISEFRNQQAQNYVGEWLTKRIRPPVHSSGIGSTCASSNYGENLERDEVELNLTMNTKFTVMKKVDPLRMTLNNSNIPRRYSF
ncbi:GTPase IMAP family member 8-like [Poeciliopsis prolifica]|uniref:GTPase IMAP family member 8-like n=1 Tax=Poeciliopsis prolifica TaxID=188132 RepID=UPI002413BDE5|nr:GTPase IMAP family member 8-like [Poeciliopsis prolifica]